VNLIPPLIRRSLVPMTLAILFFTTALRAQERPYFITYDHYLEEPGALEIAFNPVFGSQDQGNDFLAAWMEIEYGITAWWTTEFYLDGQHTFDETTVFTGYRWENRFRPLKREHPVNPILYVEYEDVNGADKVIKEVVGHDVQSDHAEPNSESRLESEREIELKLILSSTFKGWNVSENVIAVKNLAGEPWEFGYAWGISRPLALSASPEPCTFCRENFVAGLEMYGGLGDTDRFGLEDTSHYLAPALAWNLPSGVTLRLSPGWGLNHDSHPFLLRFGISKEFSGFGQSVRQLFGGRS
jgi:hypothetical protein